MTGGGAGGEQTFPDGLAPAIKRTRGSVSPFSLFLFSLFTPNLPFVCLAFSSLSHSPFFSLSLLCSSLSHSSFPPSSFSLFLLTHFLFYRSLPHSLLLVSYSLPSFHLSFPLFLSVRPLSHSLFFPSFPLSLRPLHSSLLPTSLFLVLSPPFLLNSFPFSLPQSPPPTPPPYPLVTERTRITK